MRAVVTGAARGLGRDIAASLAADGGDVVLVDVLPDVAATADELRRAGCPQVEPVVADVANEDACGQAIDAAVGVLGGLDLLVNNAAVGGPNSTLVEMTVADFRRVLDVNLVGTWLAARAVARVMTSQGTGGCIINTASIFGQHGIARAGAYGASKAGVVLLSQVLAIELAPHGIRVNAIAPGNMATEMHWDELRSRARVSGRSFAEEVEAVRASVPLGRHGTGTDVAGAVRWLASLDAAYVTGQTIGVNGGVCFG